MEGWISLHRKLLEWEWYSESGTLHLFLHLLLKANHRDKCWRGIVIKRGQYLTSIDSLSKELPLSPQQIRTRLERLKSTSEITIKTSSKNTIITVTKYENYQDDNKQDNKRITNKQQTDNKRITTTNNVNNVNNDNKIDICALKEKFKNIDVDLEFEKFTDYCRSKGKRYKNKTAAFRNWCRNAEQYKLEKQNANIRPSNQYHKPSQAEQIAAAIERLNAEFGGNV